MADINPVFEGNLWMLTPEAFLHYLPAFMDIALSRYDVASVFASELIGALTKPSRDDVVASLDGLSEMPPGIALSDPAIVGALRQQQLEWFDSGTPTAILAERFDALPDPEGAAVLAFLEASASTMARTSPSSKLGTFVA